jgi:hypothetical protein
VLVNQLRENLLAGPRFAGDEHRNGRIGQAPGDVEQFEHPRRAEHDIAVDLHRATRPQVLIFIVGVGRAVDCGLDEVGH